MGIFYKPVMKNACLRNFLIKTNTIDLIRSLKYKTIEKTVEQVHHYGWHNPHLYAIGTYQLNNNIQIRFNYCYEMDPQNLQNIKNVISCHLSML